MKKFWASICPPIHIEGRIFIIIASFVTFFVASFSGVLGAFCGFFTCAIVAFFRDPERITPEDKFSIFSPADGLVIEVRKDVSLPSNIQSFDEISKTYSKISIFLSVFDVHVNRIPISGRIKREKYCPGKYFNASLDKASEFNERQYIEIETEYGFSVYVVQIAGLIARRIVCNVKTEDEVKSGSRFGIIRFGSRAELFIPNNIKIEILTGQTVIAGETVLARISKNTLSNKNTTSSN